MKKLIVLFALSIIALSSASAQDTPVQGATVKLGKKPAGNIIATTVTGADGVFEFKNVPSGTGYFITVDYGIKEQGIKSAEQTAIENIVVNSADVTTRMTVHGAEKLLLSSKGPPKAATVTITVQGGTIRGPINTSRSNIKK